MPITIAKSLTALLPSTCGARPCNSSTAIRRPPRGDRHPCPPADQAQRDPPHPRPPRPARPVFEPRPSPVGRGLAVGALHACAQPTIDQLPRGMVMPPHKASVPIAPVVTLTARKVVMVRHRRTAVAALPGLRRQEAADELHSKGTTLRSSRSATSPVIPPARRRPPPLPFTHARLPCGESRKEHRRRPRHRSRGIGPGRRRPLAGNPGKA